MNVKETHIMQGMTKDLSVHKFNPNMAFDARNIRITALKDNKTLLAVTNEKGTREFNITGNILGTIIGTAVLNNTLVVFTTTGTPNSSESFFKSILTPFFFASSNKFTQTITFGVISII